MTPYILALLIPYAIMLPLAVLTFVCDNANTWMDKSIKAVASWIEDVITTILFARICFRRLRRRGRQ